MTVRLVIDIREPAIGDADITALLHRQPFELVTGDGTRFAVEPVAIAHSHELDNSADVVRAVERRLGLLADDGGNL
jgi:hypothetical protein